MKAFTPRQQATVNINVGASSANIRVGGSNESFNVRIFNDGTATVWINFGADNTVAATLANSMPVGPGAIEVLAVNSGGWFAAIAAGATGKIYFTPGDGI